MGKLPIISAKKLIKILEKDGYILKRKTGSHFQFKKDGKLVTVPVHGNSDISRGLLYNILKQAGYSDDEFLGKI